MRAFHEQNSSSCVEGGKESVSSSANCFPRDGHSFATGIVKKRARDDNGELIGKANPNPRLDTSELEVEFEDGSVDRYHANIIAENLFSQVDSEGRRFRVLEEIVDHRTTVHVSC